MNKMATWISLFTLLFTTIDVSADKEKHWYEVTFLQGNKPFEFYGTNSERPSELVKKLSKKDYIRIDNLMYRTKGKAGCVYKKWDTWDKDKKNYIYLNSFYVMAIHPLKSKPGGCSRTSQKQ